jgi:hypothetical protein
MATLLETWGLTHILPILEREEIDLESLPLLQPKDLLHLGLTLGVHKSVHVLTAILLYAR